MSTLEDLACRGFVASVTAYLEGELEIRAATSFEQHALVCEGCALYLRQMRATVSLVRGDRGEDDGRSTVGAPVSAGFFAYKFLRRGRKGLFSAFQWPEDDWVSIAGPPRPCRRGVHACEAGDLPYWLAEELWVIELAEPRLAAAEQIISVAGRLGPQVERWDEDLAMRFARYCATRARSRASHELSAAGFDHHAHRLDEAGEQEVGAVLAAIDAKGISSDALAACAYAAAAAESLAAPAFAAAIDVAYVAALGAARVGGAQGRGAERTDQATWLQAELGLNGTNVEPATKAHSSTSL